MGVWNNPAFVIRYAKHHGSRSLLSRINDYYLCWKYCVRQNLLITKKDHDFYLNKITTMMNVFLLLYYKKSPYLVVSKFLRLFIEKQRIKKILLRGTPLCEDIVGAIMRY